MIPQIKSMLYIEKKSEIKIFLEISNQIIQMSQITAYT